MAYFWAGLALIVCIFSYLGFAGPKNAGPSRKAQQAKIKDAFKSVNERNLSSKTVAVNKDSDQLKISQLWIYPIKSIRGCQVSSAILTRQGFYLDRSFMLLKDDEQWPSSLENMHIAKFPSMCLFHTSIKDDNTLIVTYRRPGAKTDDKADILEVALEPGSLDSLEKVPVTMHKSPSTGYNMGKKYNQWFSERFGFTVVFVFWGGNPRPVLGNLPGIPANQGPSSRNAINRILGSIPVISSLLAQDEEGIAFNDCAPYLVINESSVADVSTRLPADVEMDLTKFRANVVVSGKCGAYSEDFWGELTFGDGGSKIILTGNCGRCVSLNVDYNTGESGTGRDGQVLKLMSMDRRVDPGMKYSPIFGRYGFVAKGNEGGILSVGDNVAVSRKNEERTRFYWPGLST